MPGYNIVTSTGMGEVVEKKSRFIGELRSVSSEEEALGFVNEIKKKHYDARHNCYAYIVGDDNPVLRYSDDGEPQGTAGKPLLDILSGRNLRNVCVVVTRYFGGTLLGTGGLVRAYSEAGKLAYENAEIKEVEPLIPLDVKVSYTEQGAVEYLIKSEEIRIVDTIYDADVRFILHCPVAKKEKLLGMIKDKTAGKAVIVEEDEIYG